MQIFSCSRRELRMARLPRFSSTFAFLLSVFLCFSFSLKYLRHTLFSKISFSSCLATEILIFLVRKFSSFLFSRILILIFFFVYFQKYYPSGARNKKNPYRFSYSHHPIIASSQIPPYRRRGIYE